MLFRSELSTGTGYAANIAGIEVGTVNYGVTITKNYIHDIIQPNTGGYGAFGIYVTGVTNNTLMSINNNIIRDVKMVVYQVSSTSVYIPAAIFFTAGATGVNFDHNTIVMNSQLGAGANYSSYCINASVSGVTFTSFRNNIIINNAVSTAAYGIFTSATTNISGASMNNNDYYVPGGNIGYYNLSNQATFSAWKTATGKDAASCNVNPNFVSSTNLHINGAVASLLESGEIGRAHV